MLNEKQKRVLMYLKECANTGIPPTVREICAATGIKSTSTVHSYLKLLEEHGYITRQSGLNRAIRMPGENVVRVPLVGRVTAGQPVLAVEEIEDYVPYSGGSYPTEDLFALRAVGDSMINAGILDNDVIIVYKTPDINNGDIVVALIEDEATVKRIYYENGYIRLQPENEKYQPIIVKEALILGKVVSLLRYF
ncbi:MAG TPA: transcriptional repressor LexA [Candidatus Avimonas sp.]|jgi:repressor LexA|nr:transcriptional repressor LexA [Clostridiales bacterium]HOB37024.1 transcriptional repressor LexA [Candidatus Avimonas sp.]HQA16500.1 transcriptional repressor LexA [Candidatus Avimonas sp.]HQD38487.1 transcriptional repressor LexA [Candidatus Avimonas sp.]